MSSFFFFNLNSDLFNTHPSFIEFINGCIHFSRDTVAPQYPGNRQTQFLLSTLISDQNLKKNIYFRSEKKFFIFIVTASLQDMGHHSSPQLSGANFSSLSPFSKASSPVLSPIHRSSPVKWQAAFPYLYFSL